MKALCFLIPLLLYICKCICSHQLHVGTVLFTKSHLRKKCWTDMEINLLYARQSMQGVLPDPEYIDISKTGTISVLLEYFQSAFEAVRQSSCRKTQHLMFLALADALGGYLRSYMLPLTRQAYYAGQIKYLEARKLYQFYEEIKDFLKTNGAGWARPHTCALNYKIRPLKISLKGCDTACAQLYLKGEAQMEVCRRAQAVTDFAPVQNVMDGNRRLFDVIDVIRNRENFQSPGDNANDIVAKINLNQGNLQKIQNIRKNSQQWKQRVSSLTNSNATDYGATNFDSMNLNNSSMPILRRRRSCGKKQHDCHGQIVPLPILDDPLKPRAIALPLRIRPIRSLSSPSSISILVRYYVTVIRCLVSKTNNRCDICNFNAQFQSWLSTNVFPRLNDEEWYPAFGGVYRIAETIKTYGSDPGTTFDSTCSDIGYLFSKGYGFEELDYTGNEECLEAGASMCKQRETRLYLIVGIPLLVVLGAMLVCYCMCCRCAPKSANMTCTEAQSFCPSDRKRRVDPNNSFIVQCLVKFFKRNQDEKRDLTSIRETLNESMRSDVMTVPDKAKSRETVTTVEYRSEDPKQVKMTNVETIVLPAQVNPARELSMGFNSFWPITEFRNDELGKQYPDDGLKCLYEMKGSMSKTQRKEKEPFKTLWKREISDLRSSESFACLSPQNSRTFRERPKRKADVLSRSSCTGSGISRGSRRRRVIFLRRSRSDFDCPRSCRCSYNSSSASYTSSQPEDEDDLPAELFGHIMACSSSFSKKPRIEELKKPKTQSDSDRGMSTSNASEDSNSSVKRIP